MPLDLYQAETLDRVSSLPPATSIEPGAWDGFVRGTGLATMRGFAKTGRAIDLLGSVGPIMKDAVTGGTELQDRYFKEHDEVFGRAVDYWTPKPNEVGAAAEVVGSLVSMLPTVIASPALAVGSAQLDIAEDLVRKGVDATRAQAVGAAQGVGLGLGIWMPILGRNLWERVLVGGAGFNLVQGAATRGASEVILQGTPAAGDIKAFDGEALTLDALLGLAFGGIAHISPSQRAQGKAVWDRIGGWAKNLQPSEVDAIATLRQAQHLNVDSTPGQPVDAAAVGAHVDRVRAAIDQLVNDRPVDVEGMPASQMEPDGRFVEADKRAEALVAEGERVRTEEGLPPTPETEGPPAPTIRAEPPPPRGEGGEAPARPEAKPEGETKVVDPLSLEADRIAAEQPDRAIRIGSNPDGTPIVKTTKQFLEDARADMKKARDDAKLFEVAAGCMLGIG